MSSQKNTHRNNNIFSKILHQNLFKFRMKITHVNKKTTKKFDTGHVLRTYNMPKRKELLIPFF